MSIVKANTTLKFSVRSQHIDMSIYTPTISFQRLIDSRLKSPQKSLEKKYSMLRKPQ